MPRADEQRGPLALRLLAELRLRSDVSRQRRSGWRAVCAFEAITLEDGVDLIGVEIITVDGAAITQGKTYKVELNLWAAEKQLSRSVPRLTKFTVFEGNNEVAAGQILETLD